MVVSLAIIGWLRYHRALCRLLVLLVVFCLLLFLIMIHCLLWVESCPDVVYSMQMILSMISILTFLSIVPSYILNSSHLDTYTSISRVTCFMYSNLQRQSFFHSAVPQLLYKLILSHNIWSTSLYIFLVMLLYIDFYPSFSRITLLLTLSVIQLSTISYNTMF